MIRFACCDETIAYPPEGAAINGKNQRALNGNGRNLVTRN